MKILRYGQYTFWLSAGLMLPLVLDRVFIQPALSRYLGPDVFGGFVWILAVVNLVGSVGANGFALLMLRRFAHLDVNAARLMVRTALMLSLIAGAILLILGALASYPAAPASVRNMAAAMYVPMLIFALLRGVLLILTTVLRIHRRFVTMFLLRVVEGCVLLTILAVAQWESLWVIGSIYVLSMLASVILAVTMVREAVISPGRWWDSGVASWLLRGWLAGAMLTLLDSSQLYISRLMLGGLTGDASEVAVLYAGTSMGNLFVMPVGMLGVAVLSFLAGRTTFALAGRRAVAYFAATFGLAILVGGVSWLLGGWLVQNRYPQQASETLEFYHWIAVANGFTTFMLMLRPVAVKYASLYSTAGVSAVLLLVQLAALLWLIPISGAAGTAMALALASAVAGLVWTLYFFIIARKANQVHSSQ